MVHYLYEAMAGHNICANSGTSRIITIKDINYYMEAEKHLQELSLDPRDKLVESQGNLEPIQLSIFEEVYFGK